MPLVSVVMPLYNKEADVGRAIESVLNQTVPDFELIVVNDGSTDQGPEVVRSISDARIRVFDQENAGVSAARNRGIHESRSDLIAFLDADDEWKPDFLETILHLKEKYPSCSVFATNYVFREVNGKYHSPIIRGLPLHPWEGVIEDYFAVAARSDPPLWTSAVSVKKEALYAVSLFPEGVTLGEDLLTWARLAAHYHIAYCSKVLAIYKLGYTGYQKPTSIPDLPDPVSGALKKLLSEISLSKREWLRKYIALWHKHRASMYLRLGWRWRTLIEVIKMGRYWVNKKLFLYVVCIFMPEQILTTFLEKYQKKLSSLK